MAAVLEQVQYVEDIIATDPLWTIPKKSVAERIILLDASRNRRTPARDYDPAIAGQVVEEQLQHIEDLIHRAQTTAGQESYRRGDLSSASQSKDIGLPKEDRQVRDVPLHRLLEGASILVGFVCLLSLLSWAISDLPLIIVNPFVALLGLAVAPFLYLMGRAARI
jgi:hypothetical protein